MTDAAKRLRISVVAVLGGLALVALILGGRAPVANAAETACPKFRVVHNDRIGQLNLPAGWYDVTVLNGDKLSCAQASKLFAEFLQDWDGKLRSPWVVNVKQQTFTSGLGSNRGFRVAKSGSGGSGGGNGGSTSASCPGYFTVVHGDSIGGFDVPKGQYRITLLNPNRMTCARAVSRFQEFLLDYDGVLPQPWVLNPRSATFTKGRNGKVGFNINRAYGPPVNPKKNVRFARCRGTFRVLNNDRIGKLKLPAGPYYISVGSQTGLSCGGASNYFREFLNRTDGMLPSPWTLNARKAQFKAGNGGYVFRVQQA